MSHNSFGHLFRITTFGESHGPAIGCVIDGCPPGLALDASLIQADLDRRRPGGNAFVSQRREPDTARILSGVFEGRTTGTPIAILIENTDTRPKDYDDIVDAYRPGHADYTYDAKYGLRDHRGGGRASARETACRVAAGAIARIVLGPSITVRGALIAMGGDCINEAAWNWAQPALNPFFCPDAQAVQRWAEKLDAARKAGSSLGGIVAVQAQGVPAGWGAPIYGKLDAEIAASLMSINAVKGVEIGAGFASAAYSGEDNADEMRAGPDGPIFLSNHAGGVLGGISTGQDVLVRMAVKPTSSILTPRRTITRDGRETDIRTKGRHDPCVAIRAVPVAEAMLACVLADAKLRHRGQIG